MVEDKPSLEARRLANALHEWGCGNYVPDVSTHMQHCRDAAKLLRTLASPTVSVGVEELREASRLEAFSKSLMEALAYIRGVRKSQAERSGCAPSGEPEAAGATSS